LLTGVERRERSGETLCRAYAPGRIALVSLPPSPFSSPGASLRSLLKVFKIGEWLLIGAPQQLASVLRSEYGPQHVVINCVAASHRIIINHHPCRIPLLSIYCRSGEGTGRRSLIVIAWCMIILCVGSGIRIPSFVMKSVSGLSRALYRLYNHGNTSLMTKKA
jgi:hypothetical protein